LTAYSKRIRNEVIMIIDALARKLYIMTVHKAPFVLSLENVFLDQNISQHSNSNKAISSEDFPF